MYVLEELGEIALNSLRYWLRGSSGYRSKRIILIQRSPIQADIHIPGLHLPISLDMAIWNIVHMDIHCIR